MNETTIYNELAEIEVLKDKIRENQNQVLDLYDADHEQIELMNKLLIEMNDLIAEVDEIDREMQELLKSL